MKAHSEARRSVQQLGYEAKWEKRGDDGDGPYAHSYEQCSYCGSISPAALESVLALPGVILECADMKYGWPHKFYAHEVPNECAGQVRPYGSRSVPGQPREILYAPAPATQQLKFYTEHMEDLDDAAFAKLADLIRASSGIDFQRKDDGRIKWRRAPRKPADAAQKGE